MFCPKCGTENIESSTFCSRCGNTLTGEARLSIDRKEADKKIASAHVLNIIAVALLIVCLVAVSYIVQNNEISSTTTSSESTTVNSTSVTFEDYSRFIYFASVGSGILFFVGLAVYKSGEIATKKKLSLFYLLASIAVCAFAIFASCINALATCGISFLLLACCIMQIVAGAKFYMATKLYED